MMIGKLTVLRRLMIAVAVAGVLLFTGGSSWADAPAPDSRPVRREVVRQEHILAFRGEDPCGGHPRKMTLYYDAVFNMGPDSPRTGAGRYWTVLTQNGTFSLEPAAPGRPFYSGRFGVIAADAGAHYGPDTVLIIDMSGSGSDGSPFSARLFEHIRVTDNGFEIRLTTPVLPISELACS